MGFGVQMCAVRYVGQFLVDVPWSVIEHLAEQLRIEEVLALPMGSDTTRTPEARPAKSRAGRRRGR
ncbi:DUF4158 domain-containing protein [Streptomyces sp. NPDC057565]|uniref:DUF4158 domain-containing protein n=1 Tax=Streptomyces sp. NPDC057565 TaxID=3346169 RepID=UPI0036C3B142